MTKSRRQERRKRKSKLTTIIAGLIIIATMVGSLFFWGLDSGSGSTDSFKYNGHKFTFDGTSYFTSIKALDGKQITLRFFYAPEEISNLTFVSPDIKQTILDHGVFQITFDANSSLVNVIDYVRLDTDDDSIYRVSGKTFYESGVIKPEGNYKNFKQITCANATQYIPVIYIYSSNETSITSKDNCILVATQTQADVLAFRDLLLYLSSGIIS